METLNTMKMKLKLRYNVSIFSKSINPEFCIRSVIYMIMLFFWQISLEKIINGLQIQVIILTYHDGFHVSLPAQLDSSGGDLGQEEREGQECPCEGHDSHWA